MEPHATTVPLVRSAQLLPQRSPEALYTSLAALVPLCVTALWLHTHWSDIPERWPQHWDAYGHVNGWGTRSLADVYGPLLMGAVVVLMMCGLAAFIAFAPGTQTKLRSSGLAPLAALVWLVSGVFCAIGYFPLRMSVSPKMIAIAIGLYLLAIAIIVLFLIRRTGMVHGAATVELYDGTPDGRWHAGGLIYYNPSDAADIVPKRYGFGWTLTSPALLPLCSRGVSCS